MNNLTKTVEHLLLINPDATIKDCFTRQGNVVLIRSQDEIQFEQKVQQFRQNAFRLMKAASQGDHKKETSK